MGNGNATFLGKERKFIAFIYERLFPGRFFYVKNKGKIRRKR
jgi:hypothetical protein